MIHIEIFGLDEITRELEKQTRRKIPGAVARALSRSAHTAKKDINKRMPSIFDRPNPFTRKAVSARNAKVSNLTAYTFILPLQARYLYYQIMGGTATRPKVVPTSTARLNAYGNLPRYATKGKTVYKGRRKGRTVYYRATGGGRNRTLNVFAFLAMRRRYQKRFPFKLLVESSVRKTVYNKLKDEVRKVVK